MRHWPGRYREKNRRRHVTDNTTATIPEPEPTASAAQALRESPIEPDPNPKRRLLMKSVSSAASGSGQQSAKMPATDTEAGMQAGYSLDMGTGESTTLPRAPSANTRRRVVVKSEPVAVTTQEAVDGYREKEIRIARVEQVNWATSWSCQSRVKCSHIVKTIELLWGGLPLSKADGWNLKNHSHLTVARHLREKTHPSMLS